MKQDNLQKTPTKQTVYYDTGLVHIAEHGQAAKGNRIASENYILTVPGYTPKDSATFLQTAPEDVLMSVTEGLSALFNDLSPDPLNTMILAHFGRREDLGTDRNIINFHIPDIHIHAIAGALSPQYAHVLKDRTFHPYGNPDMYRQFARNKDDLIALPKPNLQNHDDFEVYRLPAGMAEAQEHYMMVNQNYASLPDFLASASPEEHHDFWENLRHITGDLAQRKGGFRLGYYNLDNKIGKDLGYMAVEVTGGGQLGHRGQPRRWFQKTP